MHALQTHCCTENEGRLAVIRMEHGHRITRLARVTGCGTQPQEIWRKTRLRSTMDSLYPEQVVGNISS